MSRNWVWKSLRSLIWAWICKQNTQSLSQKLSKCSVATALFSLDYYRKWRKDHDRGGSSWEKMSKSQMCLERNSSVNLSCGKARQCHPNYLRKTAAISSRETILSLCLDLVRHIWSVIFSLTIPVQEKHGHTAVGSVSDTNMTKGLKHLLYKKSQRDGIVKDWRRFIHMYQCVGQG